ncbi:MAG TPA: ABC transporter substrate-binding protein [Stellaceae bacterium]|nr:ABC transporter substrate-binding protein [Stellaceae bacterium]
MVRGHLVIRLVAALALALVAVTPRVAHAAAGGDATAFMNDLGTRVLSIINDKKEPEAQRKQQFQQLVNGAFDIPRIARFVLGRYWRTASNDERQRFAQSFERYMISVYWSRFSSYNGETFKVIGERNEGNGTILVTTQILRPESGQAPVKVNWALEKQGDHFKIRDASLEGVSQALTYRDEFSSIIERNGGQVSALIQQLDKRAKP